MALRIYEGQPFYVPGTSKEAKAYNEARDRLDIEYLGDFQYGSNFPRDARSKDVGSKYPYEGYQCQFGFWKVINKGNFEFRNRPGEAKMPSPTGGNDVLVSYVVTPRICADKDQRGLLNPYIYEANHKYADIVDPGAVALAVNGSGIVRETASVLVNELTDNAKDSLKVACEGEPVTFTGFANANHCSVMTKMVLRSSFPDVYALFPGETASAAFDPSLNPGYYDQANNQGYDSTFDQSYNPLPDIFSF